MQIVKSRELRWTGTVAGMNRQGIYAESRCGDVMETLQLEDLKGVGG